MRKYTGYATQKKVLLEGNANLLTEYFQKLFCVNDVKIAYFSSQYFQDDFSTVKFQQNLEADDENKKALWDVIAIIQEMNENLFN